MKIKLSDLRTSDIFKVTARYTPFYIVISDTVLIESNENKEIVYMGIICYKLFKTGKGIRYKLNGITPQEILNDEYPVFMDHLYTFEKISEKELPLLINEPNKTIWFNRTLKKEIKGSGSNLHKRMLDILEEEHINKQAEIDEVMTMYENGQESG